MVEKKKEYIDFRKGNRNGISSMYNIRCDPDIGIGKVSLRRIPCACSFCIEKSEFSWDNNKEDSNYKRCGVNKKH